MEPTTKGTGSKWMIGIVVIVIILIIVMLMSKKNTDAPTEDNISGASMDKSALEAEVNGSVNFDNESSMSEIDKEFQ
jgi:hypothetical protein